MVAEQIGVHPQTVVKWANEGKLPEARRLPGGERRWSQETVDSFIARLTEPWEA